MAKSGTRSILWKFAKALDSSHPGMNPNKPLSNGNKRIMKNENSSRNIAPALRPILALTGAALCLSLASCVAPYDDGYHGGHSSTTTTYQPGYRTTSLPQGYRSETISGRNYYYHNGAYYQRNSGGYVVIDAPRESRYYSDYSRSRQTVRPDGRSSTVTTYQPGYRLSSLPSGYRSENLGGSTYYYHNGAYYQRNSGGYVVTEAPRQSRYYTEYTRYR